MLKAAAQAVRVWDWLIMLSLITWAMLIAALAALVADVLAG